MPLLLVAFARWTPRLFLYAHAIIATPRHDPDATMVKTESPRKRPAEQSGVTVQIPINAPTPSPKKARASSQSPQKSPHGAKKEPQCTDGTDDESPPSADDKKHKFQRKFTAEDDMVIITHLFANKDMAKLRKLLPNRAKSSLSNRLDILLERLKAHAGT